MTDHMETTVPCRDSMGRERFAKVFLNDDANVVVKAPPGESLVLEPSRVHLLQEALHQVAVEGFTRKEARP